MSDMDSTVAGALIGSGAAVAGVVITLVAGAWQDRNRRSHETARSADDRAERLALATLERKEQLYGQFLISARDAGSLQWDALLNVNPVHVNRDNSAAYGECTHLLYALNLVASAPVVVAARQWWLALTDSLGWAANVGPREDRSHPATDELYEEHSELFDRLIACERTFLTAARSDLGVTDRLPDEYSSALGPGSGSSESNVPG
jgi:hypothetical protein